ncbi:MAG TPA: hypothetical protein VLK65_20895 [Vicinamibacteria bacterium]|nr:hypothetical protein [Vicinamibacteria bacterium]
MQIDLGSGDGKGPLRLARLEPSRLFVAVDLNDDALSRTAWRAARREARGGVRNLLCIAANARELSREIGGVADRVTIVLPWGELLRAVATPDSETLEAIAGLCQPDASLENVFSYDSRRDPSIPALRDYQNSNAAQVEAHLREPYQRAGLHIRRVEDLDQRALLDYPTTWATRLAHGSPRKVWRIRGRKDEPLACATPILRRDTVGPERDISTN